jgi:hypothetical protein
MRFATVASAMKAMSWSRPPQGQARTSRAKTFLRRSAHGTRYVRAGRSCFRGELSVLEDDEPAEASAGAGGVGSGGSSGCGTTHGRTLAFGAKTPCYAESETMLSWLPPPSAS